MATSDSWVGPTTTVQTIRSGRWLRPAAIVVPVLLAGFFLALVMVVREVHDDNEQRLLEEATDQAAALLDVSIGQVQTPLDGLARAAAASDGDEATFAEVAGPLVGERGQYERVALFAADSTTPLTVIGTDLALQADGTSVADEVLARARSDPFVVVDLLGRNRTLGYAVSDSEDDPQFVVYAEAELNPDPYEGERSDGPFFAMDYAMYLGANEESGRLLTASTGDVPIDEPRAMTTVAFGDGQLLLVMTPTRELGDPLLGDLWWIVLVSGAVITITAAAVLSRLNYGRERAIELANENESVYREQRQIAETLQLAMLPQRLTPPPGCELATRYWAAGDANLIGGDLYDVFPADGGRWVVAIGDICGQGTSAAALSAQIRHTIRGVGRHNDSPAEVLRAVHVAMADHEPSTFCTACVASFLPDARGGGELVLSLGGHPQPFLRRPDGEVVAIGAPGTILGMVEPTLYEERVTVGPGDTLVLYTDGLTDAPGTQAVPVEEIVELLSAEGGDLDVGPLADAIRSLKRRRRPGGSTDDTALVVLRFGPPGGVRPTEDRGSETAGVAGR